MSVDGAIRQLAGLCVVGKDDQHSPLLIEDSANRRLTPSNDLDARVILDNDAVAVTR